MSNTQLFVLFRLDLLRAYKEMFDLKQIEIENSRKVFYLLLIAFLLLLLRYDIGLYMDEWE